MLNDLQHAANLALLIFGSFFIFSLKLPPSSEDDSFPQRNHDYSGIIVISLWEGIIRL
jgi:hypothetical protein